MKRPHPFHFAAAAALLLFCTAPESAAQIQASPDAMVAQTIDGTTITLEYGRPSVRGREIFGGLVPWDVVWTPGANWATTLEADNDIWLNGVEVPAARYSVWVIPRPGEWMVMLNENPEIFHFVKPDSSQASIYIPAPTAESDHTEMLTWSFTEVQGDFAKLALNWATTEVPLQVEVPATRPMIPEDEMAMYVGRYNMSLIEVPGFPRESTLEVFVEDGKLRGRMGFTLHPPDDEVFDLVPVGGNRFLMALYHDGELFNVERSVGFDFHLEADRTSGFDFRGAEGTVFGTGERVGGG